MSYLKEKIYNFVTYGFTIGGITLNFGDIKSFILFIGGAVLLSLQIYLHIIKIKNEKIWIYDFEKITKELVNYP